MPAASHLHMPLAPFAHKERVLIVENLSLLVGAGMSVSAALTAIAEQLQTKSLRQAIERTIDRIESGSALWRAFDAEAGLFSPQVISLIRIGEESGRLSENLKVIAEQQQKEAEFRSKIRSAMMYPLFVLGLTGVMGIGIAWFILPRLASVFTQLNIELPLMTKILIAVGEFLDTYGTIAVPLFVLAVGSIFSVVFILPKTKHIGQEFLFRTPGTKTLLQEVELSRFGYLLGTLLAAGVPVMIALDSLRRASLYRRYERLYAAMHSDLEEGRTIAESIHAFPKSARLIPLHIQQMISEGEKSGALADTLVKIAKNYEVKTETTMKNLSVVLEPVLLVIVWVGVVSVALAVIFPIYSLIGGLNNGTTTNNESSSPAPSPSPSPIAPEPTPDQPAENASTTETIDTAEPTVEQEAELAPPTQEVVAEPSTRAMVLILPTETGYLNVRAEPSLDAPVVGQASPGEEYPLYDAVEKWFQIGLVDGGSGWIFNEYAEISR
jgi:type IV pilus assembly protein PilC